MQALVLTWRRQQQGARLMFEPEAESAVDGVWWEVVYSNTMEGAGRAMELEGALQTFAATVEVAGALGDGQLAKQMEDLGGQQGWRLGLVRLSAGAVAPVASAVCVVSEARPRRGRVFRMMALAVDKEMRGQGLASEAMARLKAELLLVVGPRFELKADLASYMKKGGAGFYAKQGWTGGKGIWSWRSEVRRCLGWRELGICLTSVQLQQRAMERHRLVTGWRQCCGSCTRGGCCWWC